MAIGRRGFLKALGKGTVVGAAMATPAAYAGGIDLATPGTKDYSAFNFECLCQRNLVARVPEKADEVVKLKCECGHPWMFQWKGDHFVTYHEERPPLGFAHIQRQAFADVDTNMDFEQRAKLKRIGVI